MSAILWLLLLWCEWKYLNIMNTSMRVTQSNWEALHSLFGYRNKRKKWVSVLFGLGNAILFSHRHLYKCVFSRSSSWRVPSYEDLFDPCEIPVFAPPQRCPRPYEAFRCSSFPLGLMEKKKKRINRICSMTKLPQFYRNLTFMSDSITVPLPPPLNFNLKALKMCFQGF